ncbi:unnamed protein product [Moneuplotes crassus]|uniref:Uncharacterized protein n=1 Tax=Euplotes crassus TaxID=5936 RepID=A0AAD1U8Q9_EUPCR|nr:unnamed protein product [Moneuplotes crassus]
MIFYRGFALSTETLVSKILIVFYLVYGDSETKDLNKLVIFATVTSLLSLAGAILLPESPRYLYERKKWQELRESISFIANLNEASMDTTYLIDSQEKDYPSVETLLRDGIFKF